jgi:hypothetical protein
MSKVTLRGIRVYEITDEELVMLDRFAKKWSAEGQTLRDYLLRAKAGELRFWRVGGAAHGLIGTSLTNGIRPRELWLEIIVGKGFVDASAALHDGLRRIAKLAGAHRISGGTCRPGLERVFQRMGLKPLSVFYSEVVK